jgi:multidrug efflux pump subunit AcrA (membrane-fusion protein)
MLDDDTRRRQDLSALKIERDEEWKSHDRVRIARIALWIGIPAILLVAIIVILGGISSAKEVRGGRVTMLTASQAQAVLSATGYVVAERKASVASKGTGRLEYLAVAEGDTVSQGEIIGRLENAEMQAALDLAIANLEQARANSTEAARAE